jgi:epoxyqueuosine reductase
MAKALGPRGSAASPPERQGPLASEGLAALARAAGFDLVGFARAESIPRQVLVDWVEAGFHADLDWLSEQVELRLDVTRLFPGARTVVSLACNYWHGDDPGPIARYARGRDYHYTLRERLRRLRRGVRAAYPWVSDYGSVDANPVMEKVWAVRAGLGFVGKNACLITPEFGSWVLLAALILDAEVDAYADPNAPGAELAVGPGGTGRCGACQLCLVSCPTGALVREQVVDARACLSFQTIENEGPVPESVREAMGGWVFGCDLCQSVCPLNAAPVVASERFAPRAVAQRSVAELATMTREEYQRWVPGTPLARAGYEGLRRNAIYALGAVGGTAARALLEGLPADDAEPIREAVRWALGRWR